MHEISRTLRILPILASGSLACSFTAAAADPGWWITGTDPVIDPLATDFNPGAANAGQAKWMATRALDALSDKLGTEADLVEDIRAELFKPTESSTEGVFFPGRPATPDGAWLAAQKAPLQIGALKALAAPFYRHTSVVNGAWVADQLEASGLTLGSTFFQDTDGTYYPWNPADNSDTAKNRAAANIGQLKLVFSQRYENFPGGAVRAGFDENILSRNDDGWTGPEALGFTISLFGQDLDSCFVNNNGNITFNTGLTTYTPLPLQTLGRTIIAPFWADVDTRNEDSNVTAFGRRRVGGRDAFGVTWVDVGYYDNKANKLNSFQLVLVERADTGTGNFDIEFNFDKIQWETGDVSGGSNGLGGKPSRSGLSNGVDRTIELDYSGQTLVQLDTNPSTGLPNTTTGLKYRSRNSTVPGRFVFQVRSDEVLGALSVNAGPDQHLASSATSTVLAGSASNPAGGSVTVHWSVLEGNAAEVNFVGTNAANTLTPTITFTAGHTYTLELTATSVADPSIRAADVVVIGP